jgi:hypothetical protein
VVYIRTDDTRCPEIMRFVDHDSFLWKFFFFRFIPNHGLFTSPNLKTNAWVKLQSKFGDYFLVLQGVGQDKVLSTYNYNQQFSNIPSNIFDPVFLETFLVFPHIWHSIATTNNPFKEWNSVQEVVVEHSTWSPCQWQSNVHVWLYNNCINARMRLSSRRLAEYISHGCV